MKIIWSQFAEKQLDLIFKYFEENVSIEKAKELIFGLISATNKLEDLPYMGQVEDALYHRKIIYRKIIYTNYKIIYSVEESKEIIKIADVFDTRQNPTKINRSK
jgi:plasmid stabilization system protein ParE